MRMNFSGLLGKNERGSLSEPSWFSFCECQRFRLIRETPVVWEDFQPDVFRFGFVKNESGARFASWTCGRRWWLLLRHLGPIAAGRSGAAVKIRDLAIDAINEGTTASNAWVVSPAARASRVRPRAFRDHCQSIVKFHRRQQRVVGTPDEHVLEIIWHIDSPFGHVRRHLAAHGQSLPLQFPP